MIMLTQFCYCGLPLYEEMGRVFCKKHGEDYSNKPKVNKRTKELHGRSKSPNRYYDYQ